MVSDFRGKKATLGLFRNLNHQVGTNTYLTYIWESKNKAEI